ncbi:hypothetical protein DL240_14765 [Lujinxingia litoralis]|uniref:Uncharacterized protein n=1 Tax=Lujinxingia litoralis TaxID=2211119 RepID=A0A328C8H2_9DELT|nr:hypothetical protein [Lujinxingia litoralis]RAL20933.1 hypothetical protein DL240_14765 [Lujinxingia litoralis]
MKQIVAALVLVGLIIVVAVVVALRHTPEQESGTLERTGVAGQHTRPEEGAKPAGEGAAADEGEHHERPVVGRKP